MAVVIPIHNDIEHTEACLASLARSAYANRDVVVVDDGSSDGSSERIAALFPAVRLVAGDGTLWWGGAASLGIADSLQRGAEYVLLLNHDATIEPDAIDHLVAAAERNGRALVGAKIYDGAGSDSVWFFGASLDRDTGEVVHAQGRDEDFVDEVETQALTGMALLVPARAFADVGGIDSATFPHYFSDIDLTLRARKRGYRLIVSPEAKVHADTLSSWSQRELQKRELSLVPKLLLLERSPYSVLVRWRFYRRYFRDRCGRVLVRNYLVLLREVILPHVVWSLARSTARVLNRLRARR